MIWKLEVGSWELGMMNGKGSQAKRLFTINYS